MIRLALLEITAGIIVFCISCYRYMWGGKGYGFKIYAFFVLILNMIIALCR